MRPKIRVRPMPSSAYVPPSTRPFTRCCRNTSGINVGGSERRSSPPPPTSSEESFLGDEVRQRDLAVFDLHDEDGRLRLAALLAGGAVLVELDGPVHAGERDLPQRGLDGLGLVLAGDLDGLGDGGDAVVAAEALGQPLEGQAGA